MCRYLKESWNWNLNYRTNSSNTNLPKLKCVFKYLWMNEIVFISHGVLSDLSCINLRKLFNLAKSCKNMISLYMFEWMEWKLKRSCTAMVVVRIKISFYMKFWKLYSKMEFSLCIGCYHLWNGFIYAVEDTILIFVYN